ncbi:hypothetical protein OIU84_000426, partial [Salix udensis]
MTHLLIVEASSSHGKASNCSNNKDPKQEFANLDDDGDSRKSAMKTLKSDVIGLDSKGKISNLTCSRTKQRKRGNETQKTAHENPDLRGKNLQEFANLDDDGDSCKSAMKTLKSYVIGLDSKATPQVLAQVSFAEFQGKISNLTCSRTKQRKRGNETQKTAHENPDLRGKNLQEFANLDDDGDSRKSAMKTLKSYVIGLDSKATPQVLAQ